MSMEPVSFVITDKINPSTAIEGAVVKVFNEYGTQVWGEVVSDSDGIASLLLPSDATYQARFFKFGVLFPKPLLFLVWGAPETNTFLVSGAPFVYPQATDPRLCVASGYLRGPSGAPASNISVQFVNRADPLLLDDSAIVAERVSVKSDDTGYIEVSLIRCATYNVVMSGRDDVYRTVFVPDNPYVNISHLIFPKIKAILDVPSSLSLTVGASVTLSPRVQTTAFWYVAAIAEEVNWLSSDDTVISVLINEDNTLTVKGLKVGTADVTATRKDDGIVRIPDTPIENMPVAVTVTT